MDKSMQTFRFLIALGERLDKGTDRPIHLLPRQDQDVLRSSVATLSALVVEHDAWVERSLNAGSATDGARLAAERCNAKADALADRIDQLCEHRLVVKAIERHGKVHESMSAKAPAKPKRRVA